MPGKKWSKSYSTSPHPPPPTHLSTYLMLFFLNKLRLILVHDSSLSPEWEIILINC